MKYLLFLLLVSYSFSQSIIPTDEAIKLNGFRKATWGMNEKQVKKTEKSKLLHKNSFSLYYQSNISGIDADAQYTFVDNQLVMGTYTIQDIHIDNSLYVKDFNELKENLSDKYGMPLVDDIDWLNNTFKDMPDFMNIAVGSGHVTYTAVWEFPKTKIIMRLSGEKLKSKIILMYTSNELEYLIDRLNTEINSDGL